jgi:CrcB protein
MNILVYIAAGGAIGSVARYLSTAVIGTILGSGFPWGILLVNVSGSMIFGLLIELMVPHWSLNTEWRAFLTIGVLGGFTTFSSFSLDAVLLMQRGDFALAAFYVVGSVALSVGALFGAMMLVRAVLA